MRNRAPFALLLLGVVLMCSAVLLAVYNLNVQDQAGRDSEEISENLTQYIPVVRSENGRPLQVPSEQTPQQAQEPVAEETPDFILNPEMPMPAIEIDGKRYIGMLNIPYLGLRLPVAAEMTNEQLRLTPCKYYGSAYTDDFVIGGHNYNSHLGGIHVLPQGSLVEFLDADGNLFTYHVAEMEILNPEDVSPMVESGYPLTLFTCTLGGQQRVTIRCSK